jgi:hypothetical protein
MKIEVLGTGCYNCVKLETLIDEVLTELGKTDVEVVRVDDEKRIRHYISVDEIPGLLIDGVQASTRARFQLARRSLNGSPGFLCPAQGSAILLLSQLADCLMTPVASL